jgi:hypothetical protein
MDLKEDQIKFGKSLEFLLGDKKEIKRKPFRLQREVKNIETTPPAMPPIEKVRDDLKKLKEEFFSSKLDKHIDIYRNSYAMMKDLYYLRRYMELPIEKRARKWCDEFNLANEIIKRLSKKKIPDSFPIKDEDMIQL